MVGFNPYGMFGTWVTGTSTQQDDTIEETIVRIGLRTYTTGTESTMFLADSTYIAPFVSTSNMYPVLGFTIPGWVTNSKVDVSMDISASSTDTLQDYLVGVYAGQMKFTGADMGMETQRIRKKAGVIFAVQPTSTSWMTVSTSMYICGGESFMIFTATTTPVYCYVRNVRITGNQVQSPAPSNDWGIIYTTGN